MRGLKAEKKFTADGKPQVGDSLNSQFAGLSISPSGMEERKAGEGDLVDVELSGPSDLSGIAGGMESEVVAEVPILGMGVRFFDRPYIEGQQPRMQYLQEAQSYFDKIAQTTSDGAKAYHAFAQICLVQKDYKKAVEFLNLSLSIDENNIKARLELANIHFLQKEYKLAIAACHKALEADEDNATACLLLGKIHHVQANVTLALEYVERAMGIDESNSEAHDLLPKICKQLKELKLDEKAETSFKSQEAKLKGLVEDEPKNQQHVKSLQNLYYTLDKLSLGKYRQAFNDDIWQTLVNLRVGGKLRIRIDNNEEIIKGILAKEGSNIFKCYKGRVDNLNAEGFAPIHVCAVSLTLVTTLIQTYKAKIDTVNSDGFTATMMAASMGRVDVVSFLLSKGANLGIVAKRMKDNIFHTIVKSHVSEEGNPRNLLEVVRTLILFLRQADKTQDQITLLEEAQRKEVTGTNLLLRLLIGRNSEGRTAMEVADRLEKTDLVGIFRETLAVLVNERLDMVTCCMYFQLNQHTRAPIFSYNDLGELRRKSPNSDRVVKHHGLYTSFLGQHLQCLPGSVLDDSSTGCKSLVEFMGDCVKLFEFKGKPAIAKENSITSTNFQIAEALQVVAVKATDHGIGKVISVFDHFVASVLTMLPAGKVLPVIKSYVVFDTLPIVQPGIVPTISIVPQVLIDSCRRFIDGHYASELEGRILKLCLEGATAISQKDIAEIFGNIKGSLSHQLGIGLHTNDEHFIKLTSEFIKQLDKEVRGYSKRAERSVFADSMVTTAGTITAIHDILIMGNKEERLPKIKLMLEQVFKKNNVVMETEQIAEVAKELIRIHDAQAQKRVGVIVAGMLRFFGESCVMLADAMREKDLGVVFINGGEDARAVVAQELRSAHMKLLSERVLTVVDEEQLDAARKKLVKKSLGSSYIEEEGMYQRMVVKERLVGVCKFNTSSNRATPSYGMLVNIIEQMTGIQVKMSAHNYGWAEKVKVLRGERKAQASTGAIASV